MFEKTKAFCDSLLEIGLPGFDLVVYKDGECVLRYMNGYSDLENKVKMNGNERFNIYSCSKVITCAAALQLYERGMFSLEDKLSDYMPEFAEMTVRCGDTVKAAKRPILIKHLFEMTAGFSYDCSSPAVPRSVPRSSMMSRGKRHRRSIYSFRPSKLAPRSLSIVVKFVIRTEISFSIRPFAIQAAR